MSELQPVQPLNPSPFKCLVATVGNIPTSFAQSLSYFEALQKLAKYIQDVLIPALNGDTEAIVELQEKYELLKTYVETYFDNLDVQEEINNKLDDMAEHGELADIIAQYLQLAGVLAFDTIADMQAATNIVNGSTAKTLGATNYLDGKGRYYKIRNITNDDVVDGVNIIQITADQTNTLIAELIPDYYINTLNTKVNTLSNKNHRKMILIGDSYCEENKGGDITNFYWQILRDNLGLTQNVNFFAGYQSGAGFGNQLFLARLQALAGTITNKDEITDILVCGGWNDSDVSGSYVTDEIFDAGILAFNNYVKSTYPNAQVTIAHISWGDPNVSNNYDAFYWQMATSIRRYKHACNSYGWRYLTGTENILHIYDATYWQSDGNHPNQNGETLLGDELTRAFISGSTHIYRVNSATIDAGLGDMEYTNFTNIHSELNGDSCRVWTAKTSVGIYFKVNETKNPTINCDGAHEYELATINSKEIVGHDLFVINSIPIYITGIHDSLPESTYAGFGDLIVKNNKLYLRPTLFDGGQRQSAINAKYIWLPNFSIGAPSIDC